MASIWSALVDNGPEKERSLPHPEVGRRWNDARYSVEATVENINRILAQKTAGDAAHRATQAALEVLGDRKFAPYPVITESPEVAIQPSQPEAPTKVENDLDIEDIERQVEAAYEPAEKVADDDTAEIS